MGISFPPPPGVGPPVPGGFAPPPPSSPPFPEVPLDNFSSAAAESLINTLPSNAALPRLPLAVYFGKVTESIVKQRAQEVENKLRDVQVLIKLWRFFTERATFAHTIINGAFTYSSFQTSLATLQIDTKRADLNAAIQNFHAIYGPQDVSQLNALNNAIDAFNAAEENYKAALASYNSALSDYNSALGDYDQAVSTYDDALEAYQNGDITEAELLAAQDTFNAAKDTCDAARDALDVQKVLLDNTVTSLGGAKSDLDDARVTYNNYVVNRQIAVNTLNLQIGIWNATLEVAKGLLIQMNSIRDTFSLPLLELPEASSLAANLSSFNYPAGSIALTLAAQFVVNVTNQTIGQPIPPSGLNGDIFGANIKIEAIGLPSIDDIPYQVSLSALTLVALYGPLTEISDVDFPEEATYATPPEEELVTPDLSPQLAAMERGKKVTLRERRFQESLEEDVIAPLEKRTLLGGAGASVQGAAMVSSVVNSLRSPLLERQLSRQAFEAFFNLYGVPLGAPLVDQMGALYDSAASLAGLTSAKIASEILGNAAVSGESGAKALNTALALGNLVQTQRFLTSGELNLTLAFFIDKEPSLTNLSPEKKANLIEALTAHLGSLALKDALAKTAAVAELPGLLPQTLATLFGEENETALASREQPLLRSILLSEQLSIAFALSFQRSEEIAQEALANVEREDQVNVIRSELAKSNLPSEIDVEREVLKALEVAEELFKQERRRVQQAKDDAFVDAIIHAMVLQDIDPSRFLMGANRIEAGSKETIEKNLMRYGLTMQEAADVAEAALAAYQSKDGASNPLGSFLIERVGGTTELSGLLKAQITNIFSPVIGVRRAREVAEDYGALIYTTPNSILNLLKDNERRMSQIADIKADARLFEDYRSATEAYRNPEIARDSPLQLGKSLLLTGLAGGLSLAGTTSADNTLGPLSNRSKHATSYPGILG